MSGTRPVLLLVEDDPDHQLLMRLALEGSELAVSIQTVGSGETALNYLHQHPPFEDRGRFPRPDLVILDLGLPGMSGFSVLRAIRENPDLRSLPVMVVTVSDDDRDRKRALEIGATVFSQKPSDFSLLMPIVRDLLEQEGNLAAG